MPRYQKRPVVIEAIQYAGDGEWHGELPDWAHEALAQGNLRRHPVFGERMQVETKEGCMIVDKDDWLIKGIAGELYPCKPDIFEASYDPA